MITVVYNKEHKKIFEPYFLGIFSGCSLPVIVVEKKDYNVIKDFSETVYFFPEDFVRCNLFVKFKNKFDYSLLPDHGIENYLEPNVFSEKRKGRLYCSASPGEFSTDKYFKDFPEFSREAKFIDEDIERFGIMYNVKKFIMYNNSVECEKFKDYSNISII